MSFLQKPYNRDDFINFVCNDFLPDFLSDMRPVRTHEKSILTKVTQLGNSKDTNLTVLEAVCEETDSKKRIAITQAAFRILRDHGIRNALIAFHDGNDQWRLSLLTSTLELKNGRVINKDSNPRRYSYLLGIGAKTRTPHKYLIEKGKVSDIKSLQERFSVEVVNKQFYESIANLFTKLVGGERGRTKYPGILKINDQSKQKGELQEFAVRLIGRIIFSWFLKEKKSTSGIPIVPNEMLSLSAASSNVDYYHAILEPLFFELLNKRVNNRHEELRQAPFNIVPYLNGGLFSPQVDDYYKQGYLFGSGKPSIVSIHDSWFTELFAVLEQYNFTVDENTSYDVDLSIDPEMLGRIFENLLAEINPDTGESARKSTGSFYTPREIVDYMVDTSLYEYLKSKTSIDDEKLHAIISWGQEDDTEHPLSGEEKKKIVDSLATLTILDPACGSGAFPIGLLQKVVYILQQVDEKADLWLKNQLATVPSPELRRDINKKYSNENYDWLRKYGVIRETIFGVDIQAIATEIAKLRCFLTLIIEEDVDDNNEGYHNRGVHALPNLDFKFVTANSLVGLPEGSSKINKPSSTMNMFDDTTHIERLKEIRNQFFGADADERARLRDEFKDLQLSMVRRARDSMGATSDLYNILSDWNPFSHEETEWFDAEWMFGLEGFDIVIANPPYVGEKGHKAIFESLKNTSLGKRFYKGKMDLFYFFFHLGLDNLSGDGILSFISTNYYPTADGAVKLRKDFYERTNVIELINFNEYKVFESALGQHNLITLLRKTILPDSTFITKQTFVNKKGGPDANEINEFLLRSGEGAVFSEVTRNKLFDGDNKYIRFAVGSSGGNDLIEKIARAGKPLSNYADTREGLHTGIDSVSEKDSNKFKDIGYSKGEGVFVLKRGENNFPHLRPWFKSSDIGHYSAKADHVAEVLYFGSNEAPTQDELAHLSKYRPLLENRSEFKSGAKKIWFELKRPRVKSMFENEKIVNPYRSKENYFALVRGPWYASADVFYTVSTSKDLSNAALCAILNSNLVRYWLMNRGKRKGDLMELKSTPIGEIPLPVPDPTTESNLAQLVEEILNILSSNPHVDISTQEAEINQIVYKLYGLTTEEIQLIEESIK